MGKVPASPKREELQTPAGLAGSHLNLALNAAMERLGFRSQMRGNGPLVFEESAAAAAAVAAAGRSSGEQQSAAKTRRARIVQEKSGMDKSIIEIITSGQWERLEPNSSRSVAIGNHHVCVSFDEEMESGYRTWEWHGHMLLFDDEEGMYKPEYVYGNYFEPLDGILKIATNLGVDRFMSSIFGNQQQLPRFY